MPAPKDKAAQAELPMTPERVAELTASLVEAIAEHAEVKAARAALYQRETACRERVTGPAAPARPAGRHLVGHVRRLPWRLRRWLDPDVRRAEAELLQLHAAIPHDQPKSAAVCRAEAALWRRMGEPRLAAQFEEAAVEADADE